MKKAIIIIMMATVICCLFSLALGASTSGNTEVINGNTYIYPNGFTETGNNGLIIMKPYTDEQIRQAEKALESVFNSLYISDDNDLHAGIASDETFINICKYESWTPDFETLYKLSSIDIKVFTKANTVSTAISTPTQTYYYI